MVTYIVRNIKNNAIDRVRRMDALCRYIDNQELTEYTTDSVRQQEGHPFEDEVLCSLDIRKIMSILNCLQDKTRLLLPVKYQI